MTDQAPKQPPIFDYGTRPATAAAHQRAINALQYIGAAVVFGTLAVVTVWFGHGIWQRAVVVRARHANRNALVRVLQAATTPEQIDDAVDPDGVVLRAKNGSWIAIRYVDGARLPRAVARDSGGGWFESDRPFGNLLAHYKLWQGPRARARATNDPDWSEQVFLSLGLNRRLDAVEQSADLSQARQRLRELGFEEFKP